MAKSFEIGNEVLEISDALESYNELHYQYMLAAEESKQRFCDLYRKEHIVSERELQNLLNQISMVLENTYFVSLRHFLEKGIYEIDRYEFEAYCEEEGYLPVYDKLNALMEKCRQIDAAKEREKAEREANVSSDTIYFAGGSGIVGTVSSVASVEIADMIVQLGHRAVNIIGDWRTERRAKRMKQSVIQDETSLTEMADSVFESAFNTHYAYIKILEERMGIEIPKYEKSDQRTALAMYHNIDMLIPEPELQGKITVRMLELNPYETEFYRMLIEHYGDSDKKLEQVADFFHVDITPVKKTLQKNYANSFAYEKVDDINAVLTDLTDRAAHYGLHTTVRDEINEEKRIGYYRWVFQKYYDKETKLYLLTPQNKERLVNLLADILKEEKKEISALFCQYYGELSSRYLLSGDDLPNGEYFAVLNSSEKEAKAFTLKWDGINYGKDRWIEYGDIHSIQVSDKMLFINDTIRIPLLQEIEAETLEKFLKEAVKFVSEKDCSEFCELLGLKEIENEVSKKFRVKLQEQFRSSEKEMRLIRKNVTIFHPADINHLSVLNNCKVKLNTFWENQEDIYPVYWLAAGEEYAVFTDQGIALTGTGEYLPYDSLEAECFIDEDKIYLKSGEKMHLLFSEECDEIEEVKQFIIYTLSLFQGKEDTMTHSICNKYETEMLLESFARWLESYLLKHVGYSEKSTIQKFFLINHNNQDFDSFLNLVRKNFDIPKDEQFLYMIRPYYYELEVVLVSDRKIYIYESGEKGAKQEIPLESVLDVRVDYASEGKEIYIDYIEKTGEAKSCLLVSPLLDSYEVSQSLVIESVLRKAFDYAKYYLGQPVSMDENVSSKQYLEKIYQASTATLPELRKHLIYMHLTEDLYKKRNWIDNARWHFLSSMSSEKILLFYNSAKLNPGSAGIVLTDRYLYVGAKKIFKIAIAEIKEVRVSSAFLYNSICIVTEQDIYETGLSGYSQIIEFEGMLSTLIFYIQTHQKEVITVLNNSEMVVERKAARRNVPGIMKDEQKEAIQRLAAFCEENADVGLFTDEAHPYILFNDEGEEFKEAFAEVVEKAEYKPDPAEVPLFLLYHGKTNAKKKFTKENEPIFVTNEYWYNLSQAGLLTSKERLPLQHARAVKIIEENVLRKARMVLCFGNEASEEYVLPEIPRDAFHLYEEFYNLLIGELKVLSGVERYTPEEINALQNEANALVDNVEHMTTEELHVVSEKLLRYDWYIAKEAEEKLEESLYADAMKKMSTYDVTEATFEELCEKRSEIMQLAYPFRYKCALLEQIDCRLMGLEKQSVEKYQKQIKSFMDENNLTGFTSGSQEDRRKEFVVQALMTIRNTEYSFWEVPLVSYISKSNQIEYILTKNKLIVFKGMNIQAYTFEEIEEFVVMQGVSSSMKLGMIVGEKEIPVTKTHDVNTERYAIALTQIVNYITKNEIEKAFRIRIRFITLRSKAKVLKGNAINMANDTVSKLSGTTEDAMNMLNNATSDTFGKISGVTEGALGKLGSIKKENTGGNPKEEEANKNAGNKKTGSMFSGLADKAKTVGNAVSDITSEKGKEDGKKSCPKCGNTVKASGKFCGKCGYRFEE